ncbi:MAG TPA: hypothetical protein VFQ19_16980 [Nocardioidaceae bacterium]|nr:hypothetical protein [Nocardioidaceae bacterium]
MIAAAAACPHPPLLFRELTGEQDVAAEIRAACHAALTSAIAVAPDVVVVVGGDRRTASWDPGLAPEVRGFGTTDPRPVSPGLPLSLGVASRLLVETGWHGPVRMHAVACDAGREEVDALAAEVASAGERVAVLVMGEGSARRGEKAPGYIDERAFGFDEATGRALRSGDLTALAAMDPGLAAELMVTGRAPFGVLAAAVSGAPARAEVLYQDDPWGVMYFVASWVFSA